MAENAISVGGVDLADPDTYEAGMPFEAFRSCGSTLRSPGTRTGTDRVSWR